MPLTPTWQTVPVFGTWRNYDGTLRAGTYKVSIPVRVINTTDDGTIFAKGQYTAGPLNTSNNLLPSFEVSVPATDDPDNTPNGWQLIVEVDLGLDPFAADAPTETYVIDVPLAALPDGINLADVVLPDTIPLPEPGLTKGVPGGIAELDVDGDVLNAAGVKVIPGGAPSWASITGKPSTFAPSAHTHPVTDMTATGTPDSTTYLRGDNTWAVPPGGGGGSGDHGGLTGLGDDDHTQYHNDARGDARYSLTSHGHDATDIADSTATGRSVLTAASASAARTAIGAGTSNLVIGTSGSTAAAGDHTQVATTISDSTAVGRAVLTSADAATARAHLGAGTSDLVVGTLSTTAKAGDWVPTLADQPAGYMWQIVQVTDNVIPARGSARTDIYATWLCWDDPNTSALASDTWHVVSQP